MDAWWVLYRRAPPELVMSCGIFVSVGKPGNASPSLTLLYYPLCWQCSSRFVRSSHFQVPMWLLLAFPNFSKMIFTSHMFFALDSPTLAWSTDVPQTAWDTRSHHERFVSVTIIRVQLLEVLPTGILRCTIACERHVSTLSTHKEDQRGIKENHYKRKTAYFGTWLEHLSFGISFIVQASEPTSEPTQGPQIFAMDADDSPRRGSGDRSRSSCLRPTKGCVNIGRFFVRCQWFPFATCMIFFCGLDLPGFPTAGWSHVISCDLQYLQYL